MKSRNRSFPLQRADDLFFLIMYAAYYLYIKENDFPDRRRNSMERCIDITFGKVIKGYESTNFGKIFI